MLNSWRRHTENYAEKRPHERFDVFSSAASFLGWSGGQRCTSPPGVAPLPVSKPRTRLLRGDWEWHGLIDPWERPGPLW